MEPGYSVGAFVERLIDNDWYPAVVTSAGSPSNTCALVYLQDAKRELSVAAEELRPAPDIWAQRSDDLAKALPVGCNVQVGAEQDALRAARIVQATAKEGCYTVVYTDCGAVEEAVEASWVHGLCCPEQAERESLLSRVADRAPPESLRRRSTTLYARPEDCPAEVNFPEAIRRTAKRSRNDESTGLGKACTCGLRHTGGGEGMPSVGSRLRRNKSLACMADLAGDLSLEPLAGRCSAQGCNKTTTYRCSKCGRVFYCSRRHQQGDWKAHHTSCTPTTRKRPRDFGEAGQVGRGGGHEPGRASCATTASVSPAEWAVPAAAEVKTGKAVGWSDGCPPGGEEPGDSWFKQDWQQEAQAKPPPEPEGVAPDPPKTGYWHSTGMGGGDVAAGGKAWPADKLGTGWDAKIKQQQEEKVQLVMEMGFEQRRVEEALRHFDYDVEKAVEHLMNGGPLPAHSWGANWTSGPAVGQPWVHNLGEGAIAAPIPSAPRHQDSVRWEMGMGRRRSDSDSSNVAVRDTAAGGGDVSAPNVSRAGTPVEEGGEDGDLQWMQQSQFDGQPYVVRVYDPPEDATPPPLVDPLEPMALLEDDRLLMRVVVTPGDTGGPTDTHEAYLDISMAAAAPLYYSLYPSTAEQAMISMRLPSVRCLMQKEHTVIPRLRRNAVGGFELLAAPWVEGEPRPTQVATSTSRPIAAHRVRLPHTAPPSADLNYEMDALPVPPSSSGYNAPAMSLVDQFPDAKEQYGGPVVQNEWHCPACTLINPGWCQTCDVCQTASPWSVSRPTATSTAEDKDEMDFEFARTGHIGEPPPLRWGQGTRYADTPTTKPPPCTCVNFVTMGYCSHQPLGFVPSCSCTSFRLGGTCAHIPPGI